MIALITDLGPVAPTRFKPRFSWTEFRG